jgi:hypothetical protein
MTGWFLMQRQKAGSGSPLTTISGTLAVLMLLATGHMVTSIIRIWEGFLNIEDSLEEFVHLTDQTARVNIAATAVWGSMMIISDTLVVW